MSNTLRNMGLAALLAVSASAFMSSQASALSMADCSAKYKAAKAAGTDGGLKWNDFRKAQCGTDAAPAVVAAPAAPAKAAKVAVPAAPATTAKVAAPAVTAATPAATPSGSFMKDCSAAWKAMKASNTVPAGMAWKDFVAAKCVVAGAPAAAAPAAPAAPAVAVAPEKKPGILGSMFGKKASVAPPEPSATPDTTPEATVDKNGKPYTAGQLAAHKRIKACGEQWRGLKAQGKTPAGMAWPQYWSACNKQLKAQGQ